MINLVPETDSILQKITEPFDFSNPAIDPETLSNSMLEFMFKNNGIGLAATQIGLNYRIFVMGQKNEQTFICFNPKIINESNDTVKSEEGCLSFPGLYISICRPKYIDVEFHNEYGQKQYETFDGILSRCFQHEFDHLNGTLFTARAGKTSLALARTRRKKNLRRLST